MTLPSSGPISFRDINIELGLSPTASRSLNDSDYRTLASVASGTIDLQDFYGKSSALITISDTTVIGSEPDPNDVMTSYQINSNGRIYDNGNDVGSWVTPNAAASNYQVRATIISGSITGSSLGTWLAVSGLPTWNLNKIGGGVGVIYGSITLEIRDTATSTVRDTATISFQAENTA